MTNEFILHEINSFKIKLAAKTPIMSPEILIADDHSMIRKGLKLYMQVNLGYNNIHEVSTSSELMKELVKKKYTHLILDIILNYKF